MHPSNETIYLQSTARENGTILYVNISEAGVPAQSFSINSVGTFSSLKNEQADGKIYPNVTALSSLSFLSSLGLILENSSQSQELVKYSGSGASTQTANVSLVSSNVFEIHATFTVSKNAKKNTIYRGSLDLNFLVLVDDSHGEMVLGTHYAMYLEIQVYVY